jgi:adenylate kinase family enzyme
MQRIVIIGPTGSGKSTLAGQLGPRLSLPIIELDTLYWRPNWQESPTDEFRGRVGSAVAGTRWIIIGNYGQARDLLWQRADTLIWLDYPLWVIFPRLFRRTVKRIVTQEELWGTGNRESWRKQFFSRESLFLWLWKSQPRQRRAYPLALAEPQHAHLRVFRFRRPAAVDQWLEALR